MLHLLKDLINFVHLTEDIYHTNNQFDPLEREPWTQKKPDFLNFGIRTNTVIENETDEGCQAFVNTVKIYFNEPLLKGIGYIKRNLSGS